MIGKQQIPLGADQIVSGMASSDFAPDGGLGTSCVNVNPFALPGAIKATVTPTDSSTNVAGTMIASAEDSQNISAYNRLYVDGVGQYYTFSGAAITKRQTGAATTKYTFGFTDMASFALNTYVTLIDNIAQWNTSSNTLDETWWTGTKSQTFHYTTSTPHPMLVFEGLLWVADGEYLHTISSAGTVTKDVLVLGSGERIQALGIDPGTGLMLISVQVTQNYSATLASKYFIYMFDGYSSKPRRKIPVDDMVTAFHSNSGTVYVGYGQRIGYFNGAGISFLRKLRNATLTGTDLPYKHHFANVGPIMLVIDGQDLLAYGEVIAGKKAWFNIMQNPVSSSQPLQLVSHTGGTTIGIAMATNKFYYFDLMSTGAGLLTLWFGTIYFPRPVYIRGVRIITNGITTTASIGGVAIQTDSAFRQPPGTLGQFVVPAAMSPKNTFDFNYTNVMGSSVQLRVTLDTQGASILKAFIYYDIAE